MKPITVVKRDGQLVPFDVLRINLAITRAQLAVGIEDPAQAQELARVVMEHLERACDQNSLGIEDVQDAVVHVLQESGNYEAAIAYARYRDARERFRRARRVLGDQNTAPHLFVVDPDGRRRAWDRVWLHELLVSRYSINAKAADDAILQVEANLADSSLTELSTPLLLSLVDAALVRCGMHDLAAERAPLRIERPLAQQMLERASDGQQAVLGCGRAVLEQLSLTERVPAQVTALYCRGRLWIDGFDDPLRGSHHTATIEGTSNPWQVITQAFSIAADAKRHWRRVSIVLPPSILGHLERGATTLVEHITALSHICFVYLYCDGRTPLLARWPFPGGRVSIATYNDDFLLLRQLQEMRLPLLSGPHLMQGNYRGRITVEAAINAQGLEGEYSQLDGLAMALVAALRLRLSQLGESAIFSGGDLRFAIFGLPSNSASIDYLERQITQEALRAGLTVNRSSHLSEEACIHLGRLLE
jgi:transcriptional regulator NrdR family protein